MRSTHPGPSVAVTAVAVFLGIGLGLDAARLTILGVAVLLQQFSVGLSNDWMDAERDRRVGRTDKPIAAGLVSVSVARVVSFALAALSMLVTLPLGWPATVAHLGFLAAGWGYNLGLKATPASVIAYCVGFGLLPVVVTLALPNPALPAPWVVATGALLGVAAHFANALPDLEDDRALGIRGLPQRLGHRYSVAVVGCSLLVAGALVLVGAQTFTPARLIAVAVACALAAASWWLGLTRPPSRLLFRLIMLAALVIVGLLGLSGNLLAA